MRFFRRKTRGEKKAQDCCWGQSFIGGIEDEDLGD